MKMFKISIVIIVLLLVGIFILGRLGRGKNVNDEKEILQTEGLTTVKLSSSSDGTYSPQIIKVKVGTRIRIEGDPKTLSGGMDTVIVDGYNIKKKISVDSNTFEFVANSKGQYRVHCANNMGNGTLIVE